jgi:hypothetical protein
MFADPNGRGFTLFYPPACIIESSCIILQSETTPLLAFFPPEDHNIPLKPGLSRT